MVQNALVRHGRPGAVAGVRTGAVRTGRVGAAVSTADLLPTFVELAGGTLEAGLDLDGRSLVSHLRGEGGHDEVFGEYMAEGTISPLMMICRGAYKFIYSEDDPCLLFDLHNDPREREELSQSPIISRCSMTF